MKVVLLGATGYVGAAILDRLVEQGHQVIAPVRSSEGAAQLAQARAVQVIPGDAADAVAMAELVRSTGSDAVIHAAAVGDWDIDQRLMEALGTALATRDRADGEPGRALVYTSGVWVLGATNGQASTEASPTNPIPIVAGRQAVEATVLARHGVRGIVIRPGVVHGRAGGIPELLVNWAREDGTGRFVAPPQGGTVTWPMVHVDDLADLYVQAVSDPRARGILHGVSETSVPVHELASAAAVAAGVTRGARPWQFADAAVELGLPFAEALVLDQEVEAPAARALGWAPFRRGAIDELASRPLPTRRGEPPNVSSPQPHAQTTQIAPANLQNEVARQALALEGVREADSLVSVPGSRAFTLLPDLAKGPAGSFQAANEFAHLHPHTDGSLHLTLPAELANRLYAAGWGEPHPISGTPLIYGPRDRTELEIVSAVIRASYAYARGWASDPMTRLQAREADNGHHAA